MVAEYISGLLAFFGISLTILIEESIGMEGHDNIEEVCLIYNAVCTLGLVLGMYFRYSLYMRWYVSRGLLTEFDTLISTGWWKDLTMEILLVMLSPLPSLQYIHYTEWNQDYNTDIVYTFN